MNDAVQGEREHLIKAIDAQRQLFQLVVEHAPAGIAVFSGSTLRVKWANPTYRQRLDEPHSSADIRGLRLQDFLPHAEESGVAGVFRNVAATGQPYFDPEYKFIGFARGVSYWRLSVLPLSTGENEVPDLMVLLTDVTDQVLTRQEVERANRMKSEFLASMSHELRTPLNAIIGFSDLLAEQKAGSLNEKQSRYLGHIRHGARHLLTLINDILDLSKIEAGRLELRKENFAADAALNEVLTLIRRLANAKQIRVETEVETSLVVFADRLRFKQVFYNLLSNGVKFTPDGGRVWISSARQEGFQEFTVSDTGIGISLDEQKVIFDEFHQASPVMRGHTEGTGLGLAISRRLVEKHGGKIWVSSSPGEGSRFTFSVPAEGAVS